MSSPKSTMEARNRNWTELPDGITVSIFSRLGAIETLKSAQFVCVTWHKICKEPMTWRTIDMCNDGDLRAVRRFFETVCRHAVDRSSGSLVAINLEHFGTNKLLEDIAASSSRIKSLKIACCYRITDYGLTNVASKLPMLEDLEISLSVFSHETLEEVGRSCPLLKSFKLNNQWHKPDHWFDENCDDELALIGDGEALAIAGTMHGLHHLQLLGNRLTNDGLCAILDCCRNLESLDLRSCFNLNLGPDLGRRCAEQIKKLRLPNDFVDDNEFVTANDYYRWYGYDKDYEEFLSLLFVDEEELLYGIPLND